MPAVIFMLRRAGWLSGLLLALAPLGLRADPDDASEEQQAAYHSSAVQQGLQRDTAKLQAQITALLADLQANGVKVDGLTDVSGVASHLSDLDQDQMQAVLTQLQQASLAADAAPRQQALLGAYQGQKDLALQLKDLASTLSAEEAQNAIPLELISLIKRESANSRQTAKLEMPYQAPDKVMTIQALVRTEQSAIGDEIGLLARHLMAANSPYAKAAAAVMNTTELNDLAAQATELTKQTDYAPAVAKQGDVRDYLVKILAAIQAQEDPSQRLEEAQEEIEQLMSDEKQEQNATADANSDPAQLQDRQEKIADQAAAASALLSPLNAAASSQVKTSEQAMDKNLADLKNPDRNPARNDENTALQALQAANQLLARQIAAAQAHDAESPDQQLADLQQLKADVDRDAQDTTATASQLSQNAQQLQQTASAQVPEAANKLGDAASALNQAQPDRGAANQDLAQASSAIQSKIDQIQQAAQAYAALAQTEQELEQAQQNAQNGQQMLNANNGQQMNDTAQQLLAAEQHAENAAQGSSPADAKQALADAAGALKNASGQTVQGNTPGAKGETARGLQSLQKAQQSLQQAMAELATRAHQAGASQRGGGSKVVSQMEKNPVNQHKAGDTGEVTGVLSPVDRQALVEYEAEKVVPEYASQIQQYRKNLADTPADSTSP